jgi:hypothetical protein
MPSSKRVDPKTGIPYGISENNWKNGAYTETGNGSYKYVGNKPVQKTATRQVFSSDGNPASEMRNNQAVAKKQLTLDNNYNSANLLRDSNIAMQDWNAGEQAKKATIPGYSPVPYGNTAAYQTDRAAAQDAMGAFKKTMADLEAKQTAERFAAQDKVNAQNLAKEEARSRIYSGDNPMVQQDIINQRTKAYAAAHPELSPEEVSQQVDKTFQPLNNEYLKSIGMVDQSGQNLYGAGSSNFDPNTGNFAISQADREGLKQFRADVAAGKYDSQIAAGDFSPSNTGIAGFDGKAPKDENMYYQGQLYSGNDTTGWAPMTNQNTNSSTQNAQPVYATGASANPTTAQAGSNSAQDMTTAIQNALKLASSANASTAQQPAGPVYATGGVSQGMGAAGMTGGTGGATTARAGAAKESSLSAPAGSSLKGGVKYNPIRYA